MPFVADDQPFDLHRQLRIPAPTPPLPCFPCHLYTRVSLIMQIFMSNLYGRHDDANLVVFSA